MMNTTFNLVAKKEKSTLSHHHKTFNRLIKTVKDLQGQQETTNRDLDLTLQFYYTSIKPDEAVLLQCRMERTKIAYQFYKTPKSLSKDELKTFKVWLTEQVNQLCSTHDPHDLIGNLKHES